MKRSDPAPLRKLAHACRTTLCALAALPCLAVAGELRETGKSYFDDKHYIEFIPGDMPLVITAPHGGTLRPFSVPDRGPSNNGCPKGKTITVTTDADSDALARELQQRFLAAYGKRPYVVIAHISRRKIDLNRDLGEAACGDADMEDAWRQWHGFVHEAVTSAAARSGGALYIDLHGHGHARQRLEIGYSLGAAQLANLAGKTASLVNAAAMKEDEEDAEPAVRHTLTNLPLLREGRTTLNELLFGARAFGTLASKAGIDAVPSGQVPYPQEGEPFFNGGYNARRYTGTQYPTVFGWQIETHRSARLASARASSSQALMEAIMQFLSLNTGLYQDAVGKQ